jgi:hypothetical protein
VVEAHSCSVIPAWLFGKTVFDELLCLGISDDFKWPCEMTVQKLCAFTVCDFAINFEKRAWFMRFPHRD